jgi:hypothetical protein
VGIFSNARHGLGFHTGEWVYDAPGQCAQTRTCTGCPDISKRVRHSHGEWRRNRPCDEATCGLVSVCAVCADTRFKSEHEPAWHYFADLPKMPDFPQKARLAKQVGFFSNACKQFARCNYCGRIEHGFRVQHDWTEPEIGTVQYVTSSDSSGHTVGNMYMKCRRCHKRETAGTIESL